MALEKKTVVDRIEILEDGQIQVRTATRIYDGGEFISSQLHRKVIEPGDDFSGEHDRVKKACQTYHTKDVVDAHIAKKAASVITAEAVTRDRKGM